MRTKYVLMALAALSVTSFASQAVSEAPQRFSIGASEPRKQQEERTRMVTLLAILGAPLLPPGIVQDRPSASPSAPQTTAAAHASPRAGDEGERIFQQNCSRCHTAPEGFSPRISGTIVRHMRVRASLSKHEEEELLRFFNP